MATGRLGVFPTRPTVSSLWVLQIILLCLALPADGPLHAWPSIAIASPTIAQASVVVIAALIERLNRCCGVKDLAYTVEPFVSP